MAAKKTKVPKHLTESMQFIQQLFEQDAQNATPTHPFLSQLLNTLHTALFVIGCLALLAVLVLGIIVDVTELRIDDLGVYIPFR